MYLKPGVVNMDTKLVKNRKNIWVESNESVAVYSASNSGAWAKIFVNQ